MSRSPDPELRQWWRQLLESFDPQRQTVKSFCSHNDVSVASFYKWRKCFAEAESSRLVAVELRESEPVNEQDRRRSDGSDTAGGHAPALIRLGGDTVIEIACAQAGLITDIAVALSRLQQERRVNL